MQLSVFEHIYSRMIEEAKKSRKSELNTREYHAGIKLLTQVRQEVKVDTVCDQGYA